ncbi:hypothetical protein JYU29_05615 [Tianweitania sp. BSSL-BM11]|uniref:Uncharacterized protein n=1 Tax=Tianweitania aestuarii TaxID=2814886 RepID=A0ABS5RSX5_9HYPH|nr:hypothetical protein [Tianweitania aestuarii]MBS9720163.1 hypothetical protein [Tianweitania aestuarii]
MPVYAKFDAIGLPLGFWPDEIYPDAEDGAPHPAVPADAVRITRQQWQAFVSNSGARRWDDGHVVPYEPPAAPEPPLILFPADLWRRTSDDEAEQIEAAMNAQSARLRNLFRTAQTYQSDDPLWPVLQAAATDLFGEERAAALLAPSI